MQKIIFIYIEINRTFLIKRTQAQLATELLHKQYIFGFKRNMLQIQAIKPKQH
jgi:hypothetical protein